jgi:hypothetical protein
MKGFSNAKEVLYRVTFMLYEVNYIKTSILLSIKPLRRTLDTEKDVVYETLQYMKLTDHFIFRPHKTRIFRGGGVY